jgi:hypothetical protein
MMLEPMTYISHYQPSEDGEGDFSSLYIFPQFFWSHSLPQPKEWRNCRHNLREPLS